MALTTSSPGRAKIVPTPGMGVSVYKGLGFGLLWESMPFVRKRIDSVFPNFCLISIILQYAWIPIVVLYLIKCLDHWMPNTPAEQIDLKYYRPLTNLENMIKVVSF